MVGERRRVSGRCAHTAGRVTHSPTGLFAIYNRSLLLWLHLAEELISSVIQPGAQGHLVGDRSAVLKPRERRSAPWSPASSWFGSTQSGTCISEEESAARPPPANSNLRATPPGPGGRLDGKLEGRVGRKTLTHTRRPHPPGDGPVGARVYSAELNPGGAGPSPSPISALPPGPVRSGLVLCFSPWACAKEEGARASRVDRAGDADRQARPLPAGKVRRGGSPDRVRSAPTPSGAPRPDSRAPRIRNAAGCAVVNSAPGKSIPDAQEPPIGFRPAAGL